jgi:putative membrane protein
MWSEKLLSKDEMQKISQVIAQAESQTSGEIVPVIVRRSSVIGHVPLMVALLLMLVFFIFELPHHISNWFFYTQEGFLSRWGAEVVLLGLSVSSLWLGKIASHWIWVQRLLVPKSDQAFQAEERAIIEFSQNRLRETEGATGILIFISLMEKHAVVLGDRAISEKLPPETWQRLLDQLVQRLKENKVQEGLEGAITECGKILTKHFPKAPNDKNELVNQLIIKE